MRLLTHNTMCNNTKAAKGKGFPLKINAVEVKVIQNPNGAGTPVGPSELEFVKRLLPTLDWSALVQAANDVGIPTLPPSLTVELSEDTSFLQALYHILMNVHLIKGMLTCPVTGREFPVTDGIPNMMLEEEECS